MVGEDTHNKDNNQITKTRQGKLWKAREDIRGETQKILKISLFDGALWKRGRNIKYVVCRVQEAIKTVEE